jgi:FkbM family methyltransferase
MVGQAMAVYQKNCFVSFLARAYAFEPNPLYREALGQYAKNDSRFHPYFVALSDREGAAELYVTQSPGSTSLFAPAKRLAEINHAGASVKNLEKVDVVTIDQWAKRNGDVAIQLMKFDIQAGELKALRGASHILQSSTLLVYTEIWFNPAYEGGALYSEIDLFLRQYDFILYDVFKPKYNPNNMIMWGNAIFINARKIEL